MAVDAGYFAVVFVEFGGDVWWDAWAFGDVVAAGAFE